MTILFLMRVFCSSAVFSCKACLQVQNLLLLHSQKFTATINCSADA